MKRLFTVVLVLLAGMVGLQAQCPDFTFAVPFTHSDNTTGAGDDCALRGTEDRTYEVTVGSAGTLMVSLCGSSYDTYLFVTDACCGGTTLGSNDDACGLQSIVSVPVTAGTYYVDVEGFSSSGAYTLDVSLIPSTPPGGCPDYSFAAPFSHTTTNAGAGDDCALRPSEDVQYEVSIGTAGTYRFSLCGGATWDTYLYLTDACCNTGSTIASNDDFCGLQSEVTAFLTPGTYYVAVEAFSAGGSGVFTLDASLVPPAPSTTCAPAYTSSPGTAIPDNTPAGITDDIVISGVDGQLSDLNVILDIDHTWVGDLIVTLEHVNTGTVATLVDRIGAPPGTFGCSNNDLDVRMDDEAGTPIETTCGGSAFPEGDFSPNNPLSVFDGESLNGTWRLTVSDNAGGDLGTLVSWCLEPALICTIASMPNMAIPDSNATGITDTISFSELNTDVITDLNIGVNITHTWVGDLVVELTHVQTGTIVTLIQTPGAPPTAASCPGDNVDAILDDGAATPVESECDTPGVPAISGTFIPNQALSAFNGETMAGDWVLRVADVGFGDVGTLVSWCMDPTTVPGIPFNDECSNALPLECGDQVTGTTVNATMDPAPFCSTAVDAPGVWYTVVGNGDSIKASLCHPGTNYDTRINVYDGSCGFLSCIGGDDDACGFAKSSEFTWLSEPCVTYYILVQGFDGQTGDFELSVSCASPPTTLVADAGPDHQFCYDNGTNFVALGGSPTGSGGFFLFPYSYSWSPTTGLSDPTASNPIAGGPALTPGTWVFTVTVTDTCGNVATDEVTVTVWENPVADAGADFGICESTPSTLIGGSPTASAGTPPYSYSWSPAGGLSSTTAANPTFTHSGVGLYTFMVTVTDANGCQDMDTVTVEVWDDPEADAGNDTTICQFEPVILGGTPTATTGTPPYTYAWTPGGELDDPTAANPTATPSITTTFTVVVTDVNGCTAQDTVRVKVFPETLVSFTGLAAEYCENEAPAVLTGTPAGGVFSGPGIVGNTFDPALAGPGTHDIIYTYVDINGCTNADTQTTVVYDAPEADAGNDTTICNNQTLTLGGTPTVMNGTPPYTISWAPTDYLSDPSAANPVFTPTAIPNYSYTVTVTDANGCTDSDVINITTLPAPAADAGPDVETCADCDAVRIGGDPTAVSGNGNLDYSYSWMPTTGLNDATVANPLANPATTTTYTVTVTDNVNGCTDTDEVTVTVNPLPVVTLSGLASSYCVDDSPVTLVGTPAGGTFYGEGVSGTASTESFTLCYDGGFRPIPDNTVPLNFVINGSGIQGDELGTNVTLDSVRVIIDHPWVGDLTMSLESPGGTIVTLFDQPGLPGMPFGCPGDNLAVNFVQGTGNDIENECNGYDPAIYGSFTAHNGDDLNSLNDGSDPNGVWGVVITDITPGMAGRLVDVTLYFTSDGFSAGGGNATFDPTTGVDTFTVYYAYTDSNGCLNIDSMTTIVNELPTALAGPDQTICANEDATLGSSPAAVNGLAPYTYSWLPATDLDDATAENPTFTPPAPGIYTYTLTVTDANGCTDEDEITITVNTVPVADAGADDEVCVDGSIVLGGSPSASGGTPPYTYAWAPGAGLSSTTASNPTFTPGGTGTYNFTLTVTDANGCQDMDTVDIIVHPLPVVDAGNNERICANESVALGGAPTASGTGPFTYSWSPSAGLDDPTASNPVFSPGAAGVVNFTVTVTDGNGCENTDVVAITVDPVPVADAGADITVCDYGDLLTLGGTPTASGGTPPYFYTWAPATGLNFTSIANPTFDPPSPGTYSFTVTVTDGQGCETSDEITVVVHPLPVVSIVGLDEEYCVDDDLVLISGTPAGGMFNGAPGVITVPYGGAQYTVSFMGTPVNIPDFDPGGVNVAQTVSVPGTSLGTDVTFDSISFAIDHTWVGDLTIELFNPSGNSVMLLDQPGGAGFCGGDDIDATVVHGMGNSMENVCSNNPAIAGTFTAHDGFDLNSLNDGSNPNGSWELLITDLGPADLGTLTSATLYFSGPATAFDPSVAGVGTHTVIYTYTDGNGCVNADTIDVTVHPLPVVDIVGLASTHCFNVPVTLTGTPAGGTFSGPGVSGNIFDPGVAGAGTHTIYYSFTDGNGCTNVDSQSVTVLDELIVDAGPDSSVCNNEAMALGGNPTASGSVPPYMYSWDPTTNLDDPTAANPFFTPTGAGTFTYTVTVTDNFGCVETDEIVVTVDTVPVVSFTGLAAQYCLGDPCDELTGMPPGGEFTGPGVVTSCEAAATCVQQNNFTGYYDPANWTFQEIPVGVGGAVNTAGAPATISLTSGNIGTSGATQFVIEIPCDGTISFDWDFITTDVDGPSFDPFGYVLNGIFTQLTNDLGPDIQSGSTTINVVAGDDFGFSQETTDGILGSATTTVSGFSGPEGSGGGGSGPCNPGSITTLFNSNNQFAGNMFNITAGSNDIEITSWAMNFASGGSGQVDVWYKTGTYQGFETNQAAWTQLGTDMVTSAGLDQPTIIDVGNTLTIPAGQTYGIFLYGDYPNIITRYSNVPPGVTQYSNGDLTIDLGVGLGNPMFGGTVFSPRIWNGTVEYNVLPCTPVSTPAPAPGGGFTVPEMMYYKFDQSGSSSVANDASSPVGTNPAPVLGALSQGGTGQFGSALVGAGGTGTNDYVNTGWATNLTSDWTMSFWFDGWNGSTFHYLLGDNTANAFRMFAAGAAGTNNLTLRGGGLANTDIPGVFPGPSVVHVVYDASVPETRAYVNGTLVNTVPQGALNIVGTGPFKIGAYATSGGLPSGVRMDEFRLYSDALGAAEITATWNEMLPVAGSGGVCLDNPVYPACDVEYTFGCASGDIINSFSTTGGLTNISNLNSGCNSSTGIAPAADFTNMVVTVPNGGGSFDFTVQGGPQFSTGFAIWVDWDQDGQFAPAEEVWNSGASAAPPATFTSTINVPGSVDGGEYIMRVRSRFVGVPTAGCGFSGTSFGEAEDYTLAVVCASTGGTCTNTFLDVETVNNPTTGTLNFTFNGTPATAPLGGTLNLDALGDLDGTGGNLEEWQIFDENNVLIGQIGATGNFGDQCNPISNSITLTQAQIQGWAANGSIDFTAVATPAVSQTLCAGDFLTLELEYCTEVSGGTGSAYFFNPDSAGPGTHTIYYTFTDDNGCTAIDSQVVVVHELPTVDATGDTTVCLGDAATLMVQASGTPGPYTYTWFPSAGLNDTSGSVVIASPDTTTQYTVYAVDSNGCSNFDTVTVAIQLPPEVEIVPEPNDSICYGDSLCLIANASGGGCTAEPITLPAHQSVWNAFGVRGHWFTAPVDFTMTSIMAPAVLPGTQQAIQVLLLPGVPPAFPGTTGGTTLFYTNSAPAGSPISVNIPISAGDVIGIVGGNYGPPLSVSYGPAPSTFNTTIGGQPVSLVRFGNQTDIIAGPLTGGFWQEPAGNLGRIEWEYCIGGTPGGGSGSGNVTYLWNTGDTTSIICPNPTQSGTYWVQVTDSLGCVGYDTIDIFVNPEIIVDAGADIDLCQGQSAVLGGNPTAIGGTPPYTYSWEPVDRLDDPTLANPTTNTLLSITYTVTVTDANGCVVEDQIRVWSRDLPKANAGDDLTICDGESIVIGGMPAATLGTGPYTYSWAPAGDLNDPTMANPTASPVTTTHYTLTVTDVYGCVDDSIMQLVVYPLPDPAVNAAGPFCANDASVFLSGVVPGGTWSGPGIVDGGTGEFDPGVAGAGTHTITYVPTNFYGCSDTGTIDIVVNAVPNVEITSATNFCLDGGIVTLTANVAGGTWSGSGIVDPSTGEFDPGVAGLGTRPIMYAFTDANGCTGYDTAMVTVSLGPDASIDPAGPFCNNDDAVTLTASTSGGTWSGTGITDPSSGTFDPGVAGAGSHVITYTVSAANGCVAIDSITIVVNGVANLVINPAGPFCQEGPKVLMSASVGGGYWSGPGITNPLIGEFTPAAAGAGLHTITYTVTGNDGCISIDTEDVLVNATPDATIASVTPMCANDPSITLTAATPGGTWSGPGITNIVAGTFDPAVAGAGTHIITYEVTDGNGCSAESQRTIKVNELPVISGSANDVLCPGDENGKIDVSVEGGAPPYSYQWSSGQTSLDIDQIAAGSYTITVTDSKGCSNEANFTVSTLSTTMAINATIQNALTPEYNNGSIDLSVTGSGPFQYNWSNGEKTEDISGLNPDTFMVVITDKYGCTETRTYIVEADFGIGIDPTDLTQNIELFPNPTKDVVNVKIDLGGATEDLTLTVYDVLGRKVYERNDRISHTYNHQIDMENWASGQYMVRFKIGEEIVTKKVVLTK